MLLKKYGGRKMKKFSVKTIVAIGIGAALFFVLGYFVKVPSPVPNTSISVQYGLLAFIAAVYGPLAGALVGFIGHALIDMASYGPWWSWITASSVFGLLMGIACILMKVDGTKSDVASMVKFNVAQVVIHAICWGAVAPALDIWWYQEPIEKLFAQGLVAGIANAVTTAIVGTLLMVAYAATKTKAGSLTKE